MHLNLGFKSRHKIDFRSLIIQNFELNASALIWLSRKLSSN